MPNTSKGVEIDPVRENLVKLLKSTPIAAINGHIAKADVCFVSHVFESFDDHLIANGVTVQEWISVKDRLPDIDGKYLVARKEGDRYSISVRKFRKEVPCWYTGYCGHWERRTNGITHWMHLPKPPKEGVDNGKA